MQKVFKYTLMDSITDPAIGPAPLAPTGLAIPLQIPVGATFVNCDMQGGDLQLWYQIDTEAATETRTFYVLATGVEIPTGLTYVGTIQQFPFVWHVYEAVMS